MKWIYSIFGVLVFLFSERSNQQMPTLYLVGDSTMASRDVPLRENPERGWGQKLHLFFNEGMNIENHARNGRSTKSFIAEGLWGKVHSKLNEGDFVIIQFGHNDQKFNDPKRFTNPYTTFYYNLAKIVADVRSKGAHPILFTPIVRRKFNEFGTLVDTHGNYPLATRMVARDLDVSFVDMQLLTEKAIQPLGPDKSKEMYVWVESGKHTKYPDGKQDDTHLSDQGSDLFASLAIKGLKSIESPLVKVMK